MDNDQRILDIISASADGKPADVGPAFNSLIGERITTLVADYKAELRAEFFGVNEEVDEDDVDVDQLEEINLDDEDTDDENA